MRDAPRPSLVTSDAYAITWWTESVTRRRRRDAND
jgi:hypothetical protein